MRLTRRSFFASIFGAVASVPLLARMSANVPEVSPGRALIPDEWINVACAEAYRLFSEGMAHAGFPIQANRVYPFELIGMVTPCGPLTEQIAVDLVSKEHVPAAIEKLVERSARERFDFWGSLQTHLPGAQAARQGPLRMVRAYNILEDQYMIRFDVLGGSTRRLHE